MTRHPDVTAHLVLSFGGRWGSLCDGVVLDAPSATLPARPQRRGEGGRGEEVWGRWLDSGGLERWWVGSIEGRGRSTSEPMSSRT